jgi:hypothetical protein
VDFAEPDFIESLPKKLMNLQPNMSFNRQWGLDKWQYQNHRGKQGKVGADLNMLKGWKLKREANVIVAIMDSGSSLIGFGWEILDKYRRN